MTPKPQSMGELTREVLKTIANPARVTMACLSDVWAQAAGPDVALKTRVMGLRRGTLMVATKSSALKGEIEAYRRPEILRRLESSAAPLRIVRLQIVLADA